MITGDNISFGLWLWKQIGIGVSSLISSIDSYSHLWPWRMRCYTGESKSPVHSLCAKNISYLILIGCHTAQRRIMKAQPATVDWYTWCVRKHSSPSCICVPHFSFRSRVILYQANGTASSSPTIINFPVRYRGCKVITDIETGKSKGYGFIIFVKKEVSQLAWRPGISFHLSKS